MKKTTRATRFTKKIDSEVLEFSESLTVDIVLFEADLKVTIAHVQMLAKCKLITKNEVFRANLEPNSRLGMGTLVDDSWDCWENKDYDTNPSGSTL